MNSQRYENKEEIVTNLYIKFTNLALQISILYDRGDFYWIGKDNSNFNGKMYGDTPRSLNKFEKSVIIDKGLNIEIIVPKDIKKFLFDYDHSKFIECNREMARDLISESYHQNQRINKEVEPNMIYITKKLESLNIHYWLSGGTLLGWYRDCGVIPHTTDIDFNLWANEYTPDIPKFFRGNDKVWLTMALGTPEDSYELRLKKGKFTYDLFYTYETPGNDTSQWCTYQLLKSVWRFDLILLRSNKLFIFFYNYYYY